MTKVRNFLLFSMLIVVAAGVLYGISGGGQGATRNRDRTEGYQVQVGWKHLKYVITIQTYVSNAKNPDVKLDYTGQYGVKVDTEGAYKQDVIYRPGTGGIIVDVSVSPGNPQATIAECSIWKTVNGNPTIQLNGPTAADRQHAAVCKWDRS